MPGHVPRRSERSHKQNSEQSVSKGRSRSSSKSRSASQRRCVRSVPNVDKSPPRKRKRSPSFGVPYEEPSVFTRNVDRRTVDRFCWICHKECDTEACNFCPRSYHENCLEKIKGNCECQLKVVGGQKNFWNLGPENLRKCLQFVIEQSIKEGKKNNQKSQAVNSLFCRLFQTWPSEKNKLCKIMDLDILIDNTNSEEPYKSTGEFFVDMKWIYHNCFVLYGPNHSITEAAFKLEKNFKQELIDMEACPECYFVKYSYLLNFFTRVCKKPHMIVWAKLRGSPYWPAKCLQISNGHADVRFFGTHDKSNIPINKCYKISIENPLKNVHQAKYMDAVNELKTYVKNYENFHGTFHYYPQKSTLEDAKKSNKKGNQLNDPEPTNQNSELKFRGVVENFEDENIMDPEGVDSDPHVVYQMTFSADEHNEPDCELNNSKDIMRFSTSPCSLPVPSLDPSLASFEHTPSLLSTGILAASSEMELPSESQNSLNIVNNLPVITSVSTNEMALNELPVNTSPVLSNDISANEVSTNPSASDSLPHITSTVSASERGIFACNNIFDQENNAELPGSDLHSELSPVSVNNLCSSIFNDGFSFLLESESDDEIQIVGEERRQTSILEDAVKFPPLADALQQVLISNRPHLGKLVSTINNIISHYTLMLTLESSFSKFEPCDVKRFINIFKNLHGKVKFLKKKLVIAEKEKEDSEKFRIEAEKRTVLAEKELKEVLTAKAQSEVKALREKAQVDRELKELKKKLEMLQSGELQNHKAELKEIIIRKAVEKLHSKNQSADSYSLKQQLDDAKEKIKFKDGTISNLNEKISALTSQLEERASHLECATVRIHTLEEELEKFKSDLSDAYIKRKPMSQFGVQTEDVDENQDSSHVGQEFPDDPSDDPDMFDSSSKEIQMERRTLIVETTDDYNGSVIQQVYERNVSQCTSVMTGSVAGPPPVMMSAAPTLLQVPLVMSAGSFISSAPGPYILDPQSSTVYLNSMESTEHNPPEATTSKHKAKSRSLAKYGGKRRKKNS